MWETMMLQVAWHHSRSFAIFTLQQQEAKTTQDLDLGAIGGDVISDVKEMIRYVAF